MNYNSEEIGKKILKERKGRGWSQKQLGERMNVTGKQISLYENGTIPTLENLLLLSKIFECEIGYLLGEKFYENKTQINTKINTMLGLNEEAITVLMNIQRKNLKFSANEMNNLNNNVLNQLICTNSFNTFFDCICGIFDLKEKDESIDNKLNAKYTQEVLDIAFDAYQSNKFYEFGLEAHGRNDIHIDAIQSIESAIDEKNSNSYQLKVLKYELNESLLEIVNELLSS